MLREIQSIIGFDAMLSLAAARGGTRFYIPGTVSSDHWLPQLIGTDLSQKLAAHFAVRGSSGFFVQLPLLPKELRILHLTNECKSAGEIALKLGISQRTVHRYRAIFREELN